MKLQFLGATDALAGSKYLLQHGASKVLVDGGLFQGCKPLRLRNWARVDHATVTSPRFSAVSAAS